MGIIRAHFGFIRYVHHPYAEKEIEVNITLLIERRSGCARKERGGFGGFHNGFPTIFLRQRKRTSVFDKSLLWHGGPCSADWSFLWRTMTGKSL
ncbi:MAG TPA: hypothetical protein DCP92_20790 [Nitrospiraceae bacterium]|nr:hypothetical protein [Nitrospiraceae bacterium]